MKKTYYMDERITKDMILAGLNKGVVKIINNPNDGCISAQIGEHWFYYTGMEDEDLTVEEYRKNYDLDTIADMIAQTINEEPINGRTEEDAWEWLYYWHYLHEHGCA